MASISVVVDAASARDYARHVADASLKIHAGVRTVIVKTAYDIEADGKAGCPVDTGYLRSTISTDIGDMDAEIGPTASYGDFVESGTSRMAPQPYMGPAADKNTADLDDRIAAVVGGLL